MIALEPDLKAVLAAQPVDFRKSGTHAVGAGERSTACEPLLRGDVFVFRSKRMDKVKLLAWDGSVMVRDEVVAPRAFHVAADPRRRGAFERNAARDDNRSNGPRRGAVGERSALARLR